MGLDIHLYRYYGSAPLSKSLDTLYSLLKEHDYDHEECGKIVQEHTAKYEPLGLVANQYGEISLMEEEADFATNQERRANAVSNLVYLRSSYNEGGFNSVMRRLLQLPDDSNAYDLYYIFDKTESLYYHLPNWHQALERAKEGKAAWLALPRPILDCSEIRLHAYESGPNSAAKALKLAQEKFRTYSTFGGSWSSLNINGFGEPIRALVHGWSEPFLKSDPDKMPCVYAVYECSPQQVDYYTDMFDIIIEMCETVIATGEPERYFFHWSG